MTDLRVVHHSRFNPENHVGGVETFALGLRQFFGTVEFTTPGSPRIPELAAEGALVICDNQTVLDWPRNYPLIGFRHGVAASKVSKTRSLVDLRLAFGQLRAARRANVHWVACAQWIAATSNRLYQSHTDQVIYHPIDLDRFDGKLTGLEPRLILHDARSPHKGKHQIRALERAFPDWRFEPLNCAPEDVPNRMRQAAAFIHISRYEGNSIVCNEAMAMDLACMFTSVGLMRDRNQPLDVWRIDTSKAFGNPDYLVHETGAFLSSLSERTWNPRRWVAQNATVEQAGLSWNEAICALRKLHDGALLNRS